MVSPGKFAYDNWKATEIKIFTLESIDVCGVVKREDDMNVINSTWTFQRRKSLGGEVWGIRHRGALHCIIYNVSCSVLCTVKKIVQSSGGSVKLGW